MTTPQTDLSQYILDKAHALSTHDHVYGIELDSKKTNGVEIRLNAEMNYGSSPFIQLNTRPDGISNLEARIIPDSFDDRFKKALLPALNSFGGLDYFMLTFKKKEPPRFQLELDNQQTLMKRILSMMRGHALQHNEVLSDARSQQDAHVLLNLLDELGVYQRVEKGAEYERGFILPTQRSRLDFKRMTQAFEYAETYNLDTHIIASNGKSGVTLVHKANAHDDEIRSQLSVMTYHPESQEDIEPTIKYVKDFFGIDMNEVVWENAQRVPYKNPIKESKKEGHFRTDNSTYVEEKRPLEVSRASFLPK